MKRIIEGSKYDTSTAKRLGDWENSCNYNDFNWCKEVLYRTKSGKYFLHGEGGPMSRYASSSGNNSWGYGERIVPLDRAEAEKWAEEHLEGDEYEEIFGEVPEDGKETLNIIISAQLKAKLWEQAESRKISIAALVEEILNKSV